MRMRYLPMCFQEAENIQHLVVSEVGFRFRHCCSLASLRDIAHVIPTPPKTEKPQSPQISPVGSCTAYELVTHEELVKRRITYAIPARILLIAFIN